MSALSWRVLYISSGCSPGSMPNGWPLCLSRLDSPFLHAPLMQGYRALSGISVVQSCEGALSYYYKAAKKGTNRCIYTACRFGIHAFHSGHTNHQAMISCRISENRGSFWYIVHVHSHTWFWRYEAKMRKNGFTLFTWNIVGDAQNVYSHWLLCGWFVLLWYMYLSVCAILDKYTNWSVHAHASSLNWMVE